MRNNIFSNSSTLENSSFAKRIFLSPATKNIYKKLVAMRREIHKHPELAFTEKQTAAFVIKRLRQLGYKITAPVAKTGVVGLLEGSARENKKNSNGSSKKYKKTILVRADMDALPVKEATGTSYASTSEGFMHACGHDGHVSILLGVAELLAARKNNLHGNVKLVFQPAEEGPGGAKYMIDEGVLQSPKVDAALGLHIWNNLPIGQIGLQDGPIMAIADEFELTIIGKGGHGADPHQAIDPIVLAAHVITALQTIVSRKTDPFETAVLSFCVIRGGDAFNIIPSQVKIAGTVRAYTPTVRNNIRKQMEEIIGGITKGFGGGYKLDYHFGYPATVNDSKITELVRNIAVSVVGASNAVVPTRSMGGEDMSYFLEKIPGCYFFLGSANSEKKLNAPHHSPYFDFDEAALPIGVEILTRAVEKLLSE